MKKYEFRGTSGAYFIWDKKNNTRYDEKLYNSYLPWVIDNLNKKWEEECQKVIWQRETVYFSFLYSNLSNYPDCFFFDIKKYKFQEIYDQIDKIQIRRLKSLLLAWIRYLKNKEFKNLINEYNEQLIMENELRIKSELFEMKKIITREDFFLAQHEINKWQLELDTPFSKESISCLNSSLKMEDFPF